MRGSTALGVAAVHVSVSKVAEGAELATPEIRRPTVTVVINVRVMNMMIMVVVKPMVVKSIPDVRGTV